MSTRGKGRRRWRGGGRRREGNENSDEIQELLLTGIFEYIKLYDELELVYIWNFSMSYSRMNRSVIDRNNFLFLRCKMSVYAYKM